MSSVLSRVLPLSQVPVPVSASVSLPASLLAAASSACEAFCCDLFCCASLQISYFEEILGQPETEFTI